MEITIHIKQQQLSLLFNKNYATNKPLKNECKDIKKKFQHLLTAKFIMVTISPDFKSIPNVPLKIETEKERNLFEIGERKHFLKFF